MIALNVMTTIRQLISYNSEVLPTYRVPTFVTSSLSSTRYRINLCILLIFILSHHVFNTQIVIIVQAQCICIHLHEQKRKHQLYMLRTYDTKRQRHTHSNKQERPLKDEINSSEQP